MPQPAWQRIDDEGNSDMATTLKREGGPHKSDPDKQEPG
ncbi:hypothetical protein MARINON1_52438 [Marinobacter salarius]|nr:hypothetical protein MARINON1_52438 [Marinobacter salarius]